MMAGHGCGGGDCFANFRRRILRQRNGENVEKLTSLDRNEALRYLGVKGGRVDAGTQSLLDECERELLEIARPQYVYRVFDISREPGGIAVQGARLVLTGESISTHLEGCDRAVLMCATVSGDVDRRLRRLEVEDMARMVVMDSLASVAVEQVCAAAEKEIADEVGGYQTWRFGIGYGDLSLELQPAFLRALDAEKRVGVCATPSCLLTPRKSVTCIIGVSDTPLEKGKRGCQTCLMRGRCQYANGGTGCGRNGD